MNRVPKSLSNTGYQKFCIYYDLIKEVTDLMWQTFVSSSSLNPIKCENKGIKVKKKVITKRTKAEERF